MINDMKIAALEAENTELKNNNEELSVQIKLLTEELFLLRQRLFGRSSEKTIIQTDDNQISLFNEAEQEATVVALQPETEEIIYRRRKPKGKREMDLSGFPTEQIIHELPEKERVCPCCGKPLRLCGHDMLRRELTVIPAQYKVIEHKQAIYVCDNTVCQDNEDKTTMVKADVPSPLIPGSGIASASLVAHIAHQKYTMALPLYRQEQEFNRENIFISRQTMANWIIYTAANYLTLVYDSMKAALIKSGVLHADETSVQVLNELGKNPAGKSYMWVYRTSCDTERHIILFEYKPNRKHENPQIFLEGFSGYLHSDGYQAYHNLPQNIIVVGCWAHMRRKFTDVLKSLPDYNRPHSSAKTGKDYCDKLFEFEREFVDLPADDNFKARYEARLEKSKPVMHEFFAWAESINALPKSALGRSLAYALNQRKRLETVLLDGRLEISNNRTERAIKPFAVGRKNWLFSNTENGAKASAVFYSIIETAKESGLLPYKYLEFIFKTAPNLDLTDKPNLAESLLPWNAPPECRISNQPDGSLR